MSNRISPPDSSPPRSTVGGSRAWRWAAGGVAVGVTAALAVAVLAAQSVPRSGSEASSGSLGADGNQGGSVGGAGQAGKIPDQKKRYETRIRQPIEQPRVDTGKVDGAGRPITVSCGSCHATTKPRTETRTGAELDEFHQGLEYAHGGLSCLSCHDAQDYDRLRMADGRGVDFAETMRLCAQCHGPQYRDYTRGSHGGMTGYWDSSRGPRERNHCVDCHDPHAPAYPLVRPAFPLPRDRGYRAESDHRPHASHE